MCGPHHTLPQPQIPAEPSCQPDIHTARNQIILLGYFSDRITFVQGSTSKQKSLAPKPNVKPYLWWTTQMHTARQQTWPAASPCTHLTSVLSHRLQFPRRSCIPTYNSLICLLMSSSLSLPSLWSEVITCKSHLGQITSSTNLTQTSLIFHKLLYCKIHVNSSHNYPEVTPRHFYLSKIF